MSREKNILALSAATTADFDHPLEMLAACHERIEDRCGLLHRLLGHLERAGFDEQAAQAATSVLRYFDTAGEHHHRDEEADLFPRLRSKTSDADASRLLARLIADHVEMRAAWKALREPLQRIAAGTSAMLDATVVARFTDFQQRHIALEEAELLPLAERLLDASDYLALGGAMAARRGVCR
jgi:hemerythrin-like domain-containing protein